MRSMSRQTCVVLAFCAAIALGAIGTAIAANADQLQQLKETHKCASCDLTDAQLSGLQLQGADLSGANLSNATFYGTNLAGANLAGAVLNGANFRLANLGGALDADLSGAITDAGTVCPSGDPGPCN